MLLVVLLNSLLKAVSNVKSTNAVIAAHLQNNQGFLFAHVTVISVASVVLHTGLEFKVSASMFFSYRCILLL